MAKRSLEKVRYEKNPEENMGKELIASLIKDIVESKEKD